jgi:hypothetical protein
MNVAMAVDADVKGLQGSPHPLDLGVQLGSHLMAEPGSTPRHEQIQQQEAEEALLEPSPFVDQQGQLLLWTEAATLHQIQMDRPGQLRKLLQPLHGVPESLSVGHDAGAPDTALPVGLDDPVRNTAADPQVIGVDDHPHRLFPPTLRSRTM